MMSPVPWIQVYDPLGGAWLSTAAAALPIVLLLGALGLLEWHSRRDDRGDGRAPAAVRLADRAGVAGGDDERVARAAVGVAGGPRLRRHVRLRPVRLEQLRRRRARRHRGGPRLDLRAGAVLS